MPLNSPSCCSSSAGGWPPINERLDASLQRFVGHPAYDVAQLRGDLDRFTFLLGGDDGEALFSRDQQR